jgi:cell fate regulator YaaT (PSP1 superfamily)
MACLGCSCSTGSSSPKDGAVKGCNGGCASGGCNRHNTYDWINALGIRDAQPFDVVEVSFKNGSRKDFFKNPPFTRAATGDYVLVESASGGYDLGKISLSGELVRMQMKRKRVRSDARLQTVIRKAHERDLERLGEVRRQEKEIMVRARAIARTLDLNMKVGDVEFQGDGRKCTFYYTADGRVDFRELIRHYAREFKVKIEMRQIGARQESARIGGIGNCGRELCCATWLSEFKSVNTAAARYQNLAINQTKLSGMCGRLKCCLNYELDAYVDALEDFPDKAERLKTQAGLAVLVKTDVFKRLMYYTYVDNRGKFFVLHVDQVWDALDMVKRGEFPASLDDIQAMAPPSDEPEEEEIDFENVHNVIQLPIEKRKKKKKKKKKGDRSESVATAIENAPLAEKPGQPQGQPANQRRSQGQRGPERGPDRGPGRNSANGGQRSAGGNRPDQRGNAQPRPEQTAGGGEGTGAPRGPRPERPPQGPPRPPRSEQPQQGGGAPRGENKGGAPRPPRPESIRPEEQPRRDNRPAERADVPAPPPAVDAGGGVEASGNNAGSGKSRFRDKKRFKTNRPPKNDG